MRFVIILFTSFILFKSALFGQSGEPVLVKDINPGPNGTRYTSEQIAFNGNLFFVGPGGIWRSDGTENGTMLIKNIISYDTNGYGPINLVSLNGSLYFNYYSNGSYQVWKSDGTTEGTNLIAGLEAELNKNFVLNGLFYFQKTGTNQAVIDLW